MNRSAQLMATKAVCRFTNTVRPFTETQRSRSSQQRRGVVPSQHRAGAAGQEFLFSFVQESGQSSEIFTRGSATGGATQPAGPERPLAAAVALSKAAAVLTVPPCPLRARLPPKACLLPGALSFIWSRARLPSSTSLFLQLCQRHVSTGSSSDFNAKQKCKYKPCG